MNVKGMCGHVRLHSDGILQSMCASKGYVRGYVPGMCDLKDCFVAMRAEN